MRRGWLAAVAVLVALVLLSCFDEAMGPAPLAGRFALSPHFASPHAGIISIARFRLILRRLSNDSIALDTVVAVAPGDTAVDLSFTVPMFTSADQFVLFLRLITPEGDTAFTAGPDTVAPSTGGIPPEVPVDLDYIGPGSNAAGVRILTLNPMVFFGQSIPVMAEAFDSADNVIPGTPIGWSSLDTLKALVPNPAQGRVVGAAQRGTAPIVATLLTGPADTIGVLVQPLPVRVSIDSGNGQTAAVGAPLASPVVALVKAADSLGVAGVVVRFTVATGTLTADSGVTNASGHASVGWTLGTIAGLYALTAKVTGIPDSLATATATALSTDASPGASVVTVSSGTVTAGSAVTLTLQAKDAQGNPLTGDGLTVVFTAVGGTSTGTISATTDHGDGTYTATFTGAKAGAPTTIGATIDGEPVTTPLPTVTVTPAAATKLGFAVEPPSTVAGAFLSPAVVVRALDAFDNVDPTFTGTVTIGIGTGPGLLFGTLSEAAEAGSVDFDDLMIDTESTGYTLVATSGALTPATSAAFDITTPTPAIVLWVNAAGGNWNNPANWIADPAGAALSRIPTAGDTVFINQPGIYTVSLDVDAHVAFLFVGGGASTDIQTLAISGNTLIHDSIAEFLGGEVGGMGVLALSGGTIASPDTIAIVGGAFNWTGGTLTGGGALMGVFGTMSLGGGLKTLTNYSLENFSSATWSAGNVTASSGGTIKNELGGTLFVSGSVTLVNGGGTPSPAFVNEGTIDIQGAALFRVGTDFTHADLAVLQGTGTLDITSPPATIIAFDGEVKPGTSPGILNITGDLPQGTGSVITLELSQPSPGVGYDQLNVSGHATLLGSIALLPSAPAPGVYKLITFGSREPVALNAIGPLDAFGVMLDTASTATSFDVTPLHSILFAGDSISTTSSNGVFRARPTPTLVALIRPEGPPNSNMTHPRWSPDRTRVTYTANPGSAPNQLHIADGKEVAHLTSTSDTSTFRPRYNPTGQRIAFQCGDNLGRDDDVCTIADVSGPISSLNAIGDGAGKTFVTDKVEAVYPAIKEGSAGFAWNPKNADVLAFFRDSISKSSPFDTVSHLITTRFDGSNIVIATPNGMPGASGPLIVEGEIDWSPDGSLIAFAAREQSDFTTSIWVIRPDGSNLKRVATETIVSLLRPVFSPDGQTILFAAFVDGFEIRNVASSASDAQGTTMTPLMNVPFDQAGYDWSPDGTEIVLNEDVRTPSWLVVKIKPSTTSATFNSDAILVGRGAISSEVHDQQPSWRP